MATARERLAAVLDEHAGDGRFSGVVRVEQGGEVLLSRALGSADRSARSPNTPDTRFGTASGSKTFTAAAVARLVDEGRLSFDARLADCLPLRFPRFDPGVTLHHLLTHTSGIPDYFDESVTTDYAALWRDRPASSMRTPADFLPMFQDLPQVFPPGARFAYNNAGFVVLGLVVEHASGMPFARFVETRVFAPCGMTDSGYFALDRLPERTASGYAIEEASGTWRANVGMLPVVGGPDGGAFTTAADMSRFWTALLEDRLLSPRTTRRMLAPHARAPEEGQGTWYGHGVWLTRNGSDVASIYAMGADPGVRFRSSVHPGRAVRVTVLGNSDRPIRALHEALVREAALATRPAGPRSATSAGETTP